MAQDTWFNLKLSSAVDLSKGKHDSIGGISGAGDLTLSFDKAKLANNLDLLDHLFAQLRTLAIGSGFK